MSKNPRKFAYIALGLLASAVVLFNNTGNRSLPEQPALAGEDRKGPSNRGRHPGNQASG